MEITYIVFRQILKMFLMMGIGFGCYKIRFFTTKGSQVLSDTALFIVLPCVIFTSFQIEYDRQILYGIIVSFVLAAAAHIVAMGAAYLLVRGGKQEQRILERFHVIYPNCGFMGVPIAQAMFGGNGVIYITAFMCAQNFLIWSHGVTSMKGGGFRKESLIQVLKAPVILALTLGMICFVLNIRIPGMLEESLESVGSMNTPLAMLVSGTAIAQTHIGKALRRARMYWMLFLRLIAVPAVVIILLSFVPVPEEIRLVTAMGISAPTAAISTMFAVKYHRDVGYAAELFAESTVCAAVTMPAMIYLAQLLF